MSQEYPQKGTLCVDCGCCSAGIYVQTEEGSFPICMACDLGELCAPRKRLAAISRNSDSTTVAAEPEPETILQPAALTDTTELIGDNTMPNILCKGGCGAVLPKTNKNGFAWGHSKSCKPDTARPPKPDATPGEAERAAESEVNLNLTEAQLNRVWQMLPLPEKALAISTAQTAIRG